MSFDATQTFHLWGTSKKNLQIEIVDKMIR